MNRNIGCDMTILVCDNNGVYLIQIKISNRNLVTYRRKWSQSLIFRFESYHYLIFKPLEF